MMLNINDGPKKMTKMTNRTNRTNKKNTMPATKMTPNLTAI